MSAARRPEEPSWPRPWIPLMRGGSLPGIITEWKRLAGQEDAAVTATSVDDFRAVMASS